MIPVGQFDNADALMAHYKALKARTSRRPVLLAPVILKPAAVVPVMPVPEPESLYRTIYAWPIGPRHMRDVLYVATPLFGTGVSSRQIINEVSAKHGIKVAVIKSAWRNAKVCRARQECFYRLRTETRMSLPQIGRLMGDKDHTSVLHGVQRWAKMLADGVVQ